MRVGFYGKLPSHGDFLRRRISDAFVDRWDAWLRDCVAASRAELGAGWLDVYLTSPAWRFVCGPGACGPAGVIGLLAPSVDSVGRYFPLTIAVELPADISVVSAATAADRFFAAAELLVIDTLAADRVDFDAFDTGVLALEAELGPILNPPALVVEEGASAILTGECPACQLPIGASSNLQSAFEQLLSRQLQAAYNPLALWWTDGSAVVEPSCLFVEGLPAPDQYTALLKGGWAEHGWQTMPSQVSGDLVFADVAAEDTEPMFFRSAAATDVGRARGNNEDGFLERPEVGLWAVADGMGGHSHGEVASRMVCDALADFQPDGTFETAIAAASDRLKQVNDHLVRAATGGSPSSTSGSTVVLLLVRGSHAAIIWAGDSRVYRWRGGQLEQLSRDHSLAALVGPAAAESSVITRAVGVQPDLRLDVHRDVVQPADRFLLCSDGLTRVIADAEICAVMDSQDIEGAVDELIKATLAAGAPDNVTVVIAEAYR
jgi:type VI secretion system protein ImpM